jgi:beta-aspartyl-dipeptidase (metallo-type)
MSVKVLRRAQVFGPQPLGLMDLVVGGGKVLWMGRSLPALGGWAEVVEEEVDLGGRVVVPGLVDCHAHVTGGGGEAGAASRVPPLVLTQLTTAGVTTVVGVLGTDGTTRMVRDLVARTYGLREEGMSAYCYTGSYEVPPVTLTGKIRDDLVFIEPIVGIGEVAISDHRSSQPTFEEIARLASDAHVAGLMTGKAGVLHLHLGDGTRRLQLVRRALAETEIPARVFHPTHVNRNRPLFEDAIDLARSAALCVDITAYDGEEEDDVGLTAADALEQAWAAGVPAERLTCSSDGGGCIPFFDDHGHVCRMDVGKPTALWSTLRELRRRGHPWERALGPMTANVASLFRWPYKGHVGLGADADWIVLSADEQHIADVMARGRWMVKQGRAVVPGRFEKV